MKLILITILSLLFIASSAQQIEIKTVKVEGGIFWMGDTCCYNNRKPVHKVTLSDFNIGVYEIMVSQFASFISATNYVTDAEKGKGSIVLVGDNWLEKDSINWRHNTRGELYPELIHNNYPVIHVSWNDANEYCKWLSNETRNKYRLPTEAEWEYAARGGKSNPNLTLFSGSNDINEVGWYIENTTPDTGVMPVGVKKPNELGIYDMTGNVWEWCHDWYKSSYEPEEQINPQGSTDGKRRTSRGGSWRTPAQPQCHITHRNSLAPEKQGNLLGFRVVKEN